MRTSKTNFMATALTLALVPGLSHGLDMAVGLKAGTTGFGVELATPLTSQFTARLGTNYFAYDDSDTLTDVDYDIDITLKTTALLLDWHPGGVGFRLTGGVYYNGNEASVESTTVGTVNIGNDTFTLNPGDKLTGDLDFPAFAPYLGIGWGESFGDDGAWSVTFDLGVMFQGSASVDLSAKGALAGQPGIDAALRQEENDAEDEFDGYQYFPVLTIGATYRF